MPYLVIEIESGSVKVYCSFLVELQTYIESMTHQTVMWMNPEWEDRSTKRLITYIPTH